MRTRVVRTSIVASAALLVLSLASAARAGDAVEGAPPPAPVNDPLICKTFAAPTGSHIGERRVCKHKTVWDQEAADARRMMNESATNQIQSPNAFSPNRPSGAAAP